MLHSSGLILNANVNTKISLTKVFSSSYEAKIEKAGSHKELNSGHLAWGTMLCNWASTTGQPQVLTILFMYCTGGTECINSVVYCHPTICFSQHESTNNGLTPDTLTAHSSEEVWIIDFLFQSKSHCHTWWSIWRIRLYGILSFPSPANGCQILDINLT